MERKKRARAFREFRKSKGLTLEGMAREANAGYAAVCKWSRGALPNDQSQYWLRKAFGPTVNAWLGEIIRNAKSQCNP